MSYEIYMPCKQTRYRLTEDKEYQDGFDVKCYEDRVFLNAIANGQRVVYRVTKEIISQHGNWAEEKSIGGIIEDPETSLRRVLLDTIVYDFNEKIESSDELLR